MILSRVAAFLLLSFFVGGTLLVVPRLDSRRVELLQDEGVGLVLPSPVYRILALEFKGILSDVIFSQAMTWYGKKVIMEEEPTAGEWEWIERNMHAATDLDPYFLDPYLFGAVNLTWEADRIEAANRLLVKGMDKRSWDSTIPFYLGFNHFYFLHENAKAAAYLIEGASRAGGGGVMAQLATRLLYQEQNTQNAIIFMRQIIDKTEDERTREIYKIRLMALENISFLERGVQAFFQKFAKFPASLSDLVRAGIIEAMPVDPYGGTFYLDAENRVKTTSELRFGSRS